MLYQHVNKKTEILEIAASNIAHLCNKYDHVFALLTFLRRVKSTKGALKPKFY